MSELPRGWIESNIGEVCNYVQRGRSPRYAEASGLPIINQKCIRWTGVDERFLKFVDPEQWSSWTEERFLVPEDVLWNSTGTGTIGRAALFTGLLAADRAVVDSHVTILRPGGAITGKYLHRFIQSPTVQNAIADMQSGTTNQVELNRTEIIETVLPLPPLAEQERIVAKLDALNAKSARVRTELARIETLVSRYKQTVLTKAFSGELTAAEVSGWSSSTLGNLALDVRYGTAQKCTFAPDLTPVLRIPNVANGRIDLSDMKHSSFNERELRNLALVEGDLLVIRSNGSLDLVGRSAIVDAAAVGMLFAGYLIRIRLDLTKALPPFIQYWMQSFAVRHTVENIAKSTSGVKNVNSQELKALQLQLPPLEEQYEIVRRIESSFTKIDRLAGQAKRALELVSKLDEAILTKAFRGELVPQDENDEPAEKLLKRIRAKRDGIRRREPSSEGQSWAETGTRANRQSKILTTSSSKEEVLNKSRKELPDNYLSDLVQKAGGEVKSDDLWRASEMDINEFYKLLRDEIAAKRLKENKERASISHAY